MHPNLLITYKKLEISKIFLRRTVALKIVKTIRVICSANVLLEKMKSKKHVF